jgi:putative aldouronate transport system substrate-binding protein
VAAKTVPSVGVTRDAPKIQVDELTKAGVMQGMIDAKELYEKAGVIKPDYITPLVFTEQELEVLTPLKTDIDTFRNEWIDKFITGIEPMDKYDGFVDQLKAIGLDKYLEIYNAALKRYLGT